MKYCFTRIRIFYSVVILIIPLFVSGQGDFCSEAILLEDGVQYDGLMDNLSIYQFDGCSNTWNNYQLVHSITSNSTGTATITFSENWFAGYDVMIFDGCDANNWNCVESFYSGQTLSDGQQFEVDSSVTYYIVVAESVAGAGGDANYDIKIDLPDSAEQLPFIATWNTDAPGTSCSSCITIPTVGGGYNYDVDWDNDGVFDEFGISGSVTHDFGAPGIYTIALRGDFPRIVFDYAGDRLKILTIDQWGDIAWSSFGRAFAGCENLDIVAPDLPDLSSVTIMSQCFANCRSLSQGCADWDVSEVQTLASMYSGCVNFNEDLGGWDVSRVTNTTGMFQFASSFNQDIGSWDMSSVTTMASMFDGAISFNQDIGFWDVSSVTDMSNMFGSVGQVAFPSPNAFNQDISGWDVSNVTNMAEMFLGCESFDQDISDWDVSNVTSVVSMFREATNFNRNLGFWNLSSLTDARFMLNNSGLSCQNYSATLIGWSENSNSPTNVELGAGGLEYNESAVLAREDLISKGWTITGDSQGECTVSADDQLQLNVQVYPNPTVGFLYIGGDQKYQYTIIDQLGRTIAEGRTQSIIDVSILDSGVYYFRLEDELSALSVTRKIIKY